MNYKQIILDALKERNITLIEWIDVPKEPERWAYAYPVDRECILPIPKDVDNFAVCWHEIAHIDLNHKSYKLRYLEEYEAEVSALTRLKEHGLRSAKYKQGAKIHVAALIYYALRKGHNMKDVPREVKKWLGRDYAKLISKARISRKEGPYLIE